MREEDIAGQCYSQRVALTLGALKYCTAAGKK